MSSNAIEYLFQINFCSYVYLNYPARAARVGVKLLGLVSIYIIMYMFVDKKNFDLYFSDRLTFSNICSRTSRRIYRLALPLQFSEMLSSLSKSRISIFNAHLTLFVHRKMSHNSIGYVLAKDEAPQPF